MKLPTMLFKIPKELFEDFEEVSGRNFCPSDGRHIETFAYILGEAAQPSSGISATGLLYPDQDGFPGHVNSKGRTINVATKVVGEQQTYACLLYS